MLQTIFALALWPVHRYLPESRALAAALRRTRAAVPLPAAPPPKRPPPPSRFWRPAPPWLGSIRPAPWRRALSRAVQPGGAHSPGRARARPPARPHRPRTRQRRRYRAARSGPRACRPYAALHQRRARCRRQRRPASRVPARTPRNRRAAAGTARRRRFAAARRDCAPTRAGSWTRSPDNSPPPWNWPRIPARPACSEFDRREAAQPWRLRLAGVLAVLRANLTLDSAAFRHALRLAVCVVIADARRAQHRLASRLLGAHDRGHRAQARFHHHLQPRRPAPGRHVHRTRAGHRAVPLLSRPLPHGAGAADRHIHVLDALGRSGELRRPGDRADRRWWCCSSPAPAWRPRK